MCDADRADKPGTSRSAATPCTVCGAPELITEASIFLTDDDHSLVAEQGTPDVAVITRIVEHVHSNE